MCGDRTLCMLQCAVVEVMQFVLNRASGSSVDATSEGTNKETSVV